MGFPNLHILGKVELDVTATAQGSLIIQSDIPGGTMADRVTIPVLPTPRGIVQHRLPYTLQGHLFLFKYSPGPGTAHLYGVRVWARELPNAPWQWYKLPVLETSVAADAWVSIKLDMPPSPDAYSSFHIEIPPTGEWTGMKLMIEATPNDWRDFKLPLRETPPLPGWVSLQVDE